jgi:hypothetical protein
VPQVATQCCWASTGSAAAAKRRILCIGAFYRSATRRSVGQAAGICQVIARTSPELRILTLHRVKATVLDACVTIRDLPEE